MDKTHQGGLRILFADDEAHLRDLMQMELPRLGHEVTVCPDGTAAVKALEKGSFDVALLDIKMPGLTGIEVLAKVRQASPDTQVIIMTGHATVDTAVQALRLGALRLSDQALQVGRAGSPPRQGRRTSRPDQQGDRLRDPAQGRRGDAPCWSATPRRCRRSAARSTWSRPPMPAS